MLEKLFITDTLRVWRDKINNLINRVEIAFIHNKLYTGENIAKLFPKSENTEVGDIIALDLNSVEEKYGKAIKPVCIVGIHSDNYSYIINSEEVDLETSLNTHIPVALVGVAKTKVIGAVNKGDRLVLSETNAGVARKFKPDDDIKNVIGFAIQSNSSEFIKLVKVFIG